MRKHAPRKNSHPSDGIGSLPSVGCLRPVGHTLTVAFATGRENIQTARRIRICWRWAGANQKLPGTRPIRPLPQNAIMRGVDEGTVSS